MSCVFTLWFYKTRKFLLTRLLPRLYHVSVKEEFSWFYKTRQNNMDNKNNKIPLYNEISQYAMIHNAKTICICALYISFCNHFNKADSDLYKNAISVCNKDDITKGLLSLIKDRTSGYDKTLFATSALDFASNNFLDYGFINSNSHLSEIVANLLEIQKSDVVCDFGSGYGSFLGYIANNMDDPVFRHNLFGYEINDDSCLLSKMILEMCGAKYTILNNDFLSLSNTVNYDKGYVFPPFGIRFERNSVELNNNLKSLINSRTSTEWLFVLKALSAMKENGKLITLLPEYTLFKASDSPIRKYLLENKMIEGIVSLPSNAAPYNNAKLAIVVISNDNKDFKYINGEELLKDLPIKGLNSKEASGDIVVAYNSNQSERYTIVNIENIHYNLAYNSIVRKVEDDNLPELDKVADIYRGCAWTLSSFKDDIVGNESAYQLLASGDISDTGSIDYNNLVYIGGDRKLDKYAVEEGDLVITAKSTRVKIAVIKNKPNRKIIVTGGMIIVRPHKNELVSTYLKVYLDSERGRKQLSMIQKGAVIVTIPFENFQKLKVNLPSINEQLDIGNRFDSLIKDIDHKKEELRKSEESLMNFVNETVK